MNDWLTDWWKSGPEGKAELAWVLGVAGMLCLGFGIAGMLVPHVMAAMARSSGQVSEPAWWLSQGWLIAPGVSLFCFSFFCQRQATKLRRMRW